MNFNFRKANKSEINIAFKLLKEAAEWLQEEGIDYWQAWHNPPQKFKDWIKEGFKNNQFYFVERNEEIIGMYRLQYNDEMFWGQKDDRAGYIHSFTTKRSLTGQGIGTKILNYIKNKLASESINVLRLDCGADNRNLCRYYENHGFDKVGQTEVEGEELNLYEKVIE